MTHLTPYNIHFTLIGWVVLLWVLVLINRTKAGHTLIFYSLVLIAVLLFVANYARIIPRLIQVPQGGATL